MHGPTFRTMWRVDVLLNKMKKTDVGRHREVGVYLGGVGVNMIKTDEMKSSKK